MRLLFRYCFVAVISLLLIALLNFTADAQQNNPLTQSSDYSTEGETSPIDEAAVDQLRAMTPREIGAVKNSLHIGFVAPVL